VPADADVTEFHTFAEAAKRVPKGIICLLSALRFHNIGTQNPFEVWMASGEKIVARAPPTPEYASCASQSHPL
jgi:predicted transcriptional regulator of viral defense system